MKYIYAVVKVDSGAEKHLFAERLQAELFIEYMESKSKNYVIRRKVLCDKFTEALEMSKKGIIV